MKVFLLIAVLAQSVASAAAQDQTEPAAQYKLLLKEYSTASRGFWSAKTDLQRKLAAEQFAEFPQKFLDLAEKHPNDPIALPALQQAIQAIVSVDSQTQNCWELNRSEFPVGISGASASRIVELLLRNHLKSEHLAPICDRMRYSIRNEFGTFLSAVVKSNPHTNVQGLAGLAEAQLMRNQLYIAERASARPEWITRYSAILGKEHFESLCGTGRRAFEDRMEALYEQAAKFDDVPNFTFSETIAEKATAELFEIRHLSIGKMAPDIDGQDQLGKPMKLSDYRGKVVLLYFWQEY